MADRPLWKVMHGAYHDGYEASRDVGDPIAYGYAAELRAIADEAPVGLRGMTPGNIAVVQAWLRAEADRAEAREVNDD